MPLTIPDKGEGQNDVQSILFQEDLNILLAGIAGTECVLSGLAVTAQGSPNMTVAVAKGAVMSQGAMFAVAANASVAIGAADGTNPRLDYVVINSSGAIAVRAGTAAAAPKPPALSAGDVALAQVFVPASDTTISADQIVDKRVVWSKGTITIFKETTAKTQANSAAGVSAFTSAPVIPSGLFLAGKVLRVRMGGNVLHNTATAMTITLAISYGGTTLFQDVGLTYGTTADTDRQAWRLEFDLIANANNNQRLVGFFIAQGPTVTAPTTGIGDIASDEILGHSPITSANGGIAVDSDAANRTLDVTLTMSAASASHEWVREYATVELIG